MFEQPLKKRIETERDILELDPQGSEKSMECGEMVGRDLCNRNFESDQRHRRLGIWPNRLCKATGGNLSIW